MPQFDLNFDFGHPGGKAVNTTSTELLRPRAAKPTVAEEALIRRNRAGYTRKELSQRGTPQKTGLPAESTTITADRRKDKNTIEWAGTEVDRIWQGAISPETRKLYIGYLISRAGNQRTPKGTTFEPYVKDLVDLVRQNRTAEIRKHVEKFKYDRYIASGDKATPGVSQDDKIPYLGAPGDPNPRLAAELKSPGPQPDRPKLSRADMLNDHNTIEWAGANLDKRFGGNLDPENRALFLSYLRVKAGGDRTDPTLQKAGDGRTLRGFEVYIPDLMDKVAAGRINEIRQEVASARAMRDTPPEVDNRGGMFSLAGKNVDDVYNEAIRAGATPADAEAHVSKTIGKPWVNTTRPTPDRQKMFDGLVRSGKEPWDAARTVIAQTAPHLSKEEAQRMTNALAGLPANAKLKDPRDLPRRPQIRDTYVRAAVSARKASPLAGTSEDVDDALAADSFWLGEAGKNLAKSTLKSAFIRGKDASKDSDADLWINAAYAGQSPFSTALTMMSGKAIEEHSAEERGAAMIGDFAAQVVMTGLLSGLGKATSARVAESAFGGTRIGSIFTKDAFSAGAIEMQLRRLGAHGASGGLAVAKESLSRLGAYAPQFFALDLPGFSYMIKESGGDVGKAAKGFKDQILGGFNPANYGENIPFDQKATSAIGMATGLMMALGAFHFGYSALTHLRVGINAGTSPLHGTDFTSMTERDIADIAKAAEVIRASGAREEGFAKLTADVRSRTARTAAEIALEAKLMMDRQGVTRRLGMERVKQIAMDIGTVKAAGDALDAVKSGIKGEDAEGAQSAKQPAPDAQSEPTATPPAPDVVAPATEGPFPATAEGGLAPEVGTPPVEPSPVPSNSGAAPIATPVPQGAAASMVNPGSPEEQERNSLIQQLEALNGGKPVQTEGLDVAALRTAVETLNAKKAAGPTGEGENLIPAMLEGAASGIRDSVNPNRPPSTPKSEAGKEVKAAVESSLEKAAAPKPAEIKAALGKVSDNLVKRVIATSEVKNALANSPDNLKTEVLAQIKQHIGDLTTEMAKSGITPAEAKVLNEINTPDSINSLAEVIVKGLKPAETKPARTGEGVLDSSVTAAVERARAGSQFNLSDSGTNEWGNEQIAGAKKQIEKAIEEHGKDAVVASLKKIEARAGESAPAAKRMREGIEKREDAPAEPKRKKVYNTDKSAVAAALKKGEYVNADIVADYPDLVEKYGRSNRRAGMLLKEYKPVTKTVEEWQDHVSAKVRESGQRTLIEPVEIVPGIVLDGNSLLWDGGRSMLIPADIYGKEQDKGRAVALNLESITKDLNKKWQPSLDEESPSNKTQAQKEPEKAAPSNDRQVNEKATPPKEEPKAEAPKDGEIPKADAEGYGSTVDEQTKREYEEMKARRKKAREEAAAGGEMKAGSGIAWDEGDYDDLLVAMKYHAKAIGAEALKAAKAVREMIARALVDIEHPETPDKAELDKAARLAMRAAGMSLEDAKAIVEGASAPEAELPEGFEKLPYDHDKYFLDSLASPNATVKDVPIEDFVPLRARPDGIANANKIMLVVKPEGRREPVSVVEEGGKYKIMDGNSTFANAKMSGWKDLRVQVFKTEADALEHERLGKEAKKVQKAAMAKVKETVIKSIAEPIAKEIAQSHDDAANLTDDQLRSLVDERAERFAKDKLASLSKQLPEGKEFFERMLGMVDGANDDLLAKVAEFIHKPEIDITAHDHMVKPDAPASVPAHETIDLTLSRSEQAKQLHEQAVERLPDYQEWLKSTLKVDGVDKHYEGVKSLEGIADKPGRGDWIAGKEYRDVKHVQDALRSTSVISTIDAISELASTLPEGWTVAEFKNRFLKPTELGYMDINVTLRMPDGFLTEHQINFDQMIEAKQGAGHFLYEVARSLGDPSKLSGKIADIYREAGQLQAMAYGQAWEKFLHQADLTEDAATASLAKASDSWSSRTRQLDSSGSRATSPGAQTPSRLTNEEPGSTMTKASSESLDNQPLGDTRENLISTSNSSIDDPAAKPVQKGGYRSYNQAKGRGVMVYGVGHDAPVLKWASDIQRDLFDLHKQMIKLGGIKGRSKAALSLKEKTNTVIKLTGQHIEEQTGLSGKEVLAAAAKVHDDVRAQMKGVGKGQSKDLDENLFGVGEKLGYNKPSDDQSSARSKGPTDTGEPGSGSVRLLDEQPAKPLSGATEGGDSGAGVREGSEPDTGVAHAPGSDERPSGSKRPANSSGSGNNGRTGTGYHSDNLVLPAGEFVEIPASKTAKAKTVVEVMDTLHAIEDRGGKATLEEKMILAKYPGWGWTGDLLNPKNAKPDSPLHGDYMAIMERLDPTERAEAFSAILNSHYTSPEVVSAIWDGVRRLGVTEGQPLLAMEPSAGSGLFVTQSGMEGIDWRLVEKDGLTARILRAIHTGAEVVHNGFEKTPKDQGVDLAISNVPFGNFGVTDVGFQKKVGKWVTESIHNYFIARMIAETRENGLVVAITSRYTMDGRTASHIQMREYMHQNAELLLAVRLPETAFRGAANTDVVTDILFMRKRVAGEAIGPNPYGQSTPLEGLLATDGSEAYVNEYYHAHPERQLGKPAMEKGMFASETYTLKGNGDLNAQLSAMLENLPRNVFEHGDARTKVEGGPPVRVPNDVRSGAMFDGKERGIFRNAGGLSVRLNVADSAKVLPKKFQKAAAAIELQKKMEATSRDFFRIRDAVHATISGMRGGVDDIELGVLQDDLKSAIEAYRKEHGPLNQQNLGNKGEPLYPWWYDDPDGPTVRALEVFDFDTKEVKGFAALVTSRNIDPVRKVTKADSAQDALYASLHNSGRVDVKAMAALAGTSEKQITKDLEGVIFYDHSAKEWQLADQYAQGNVREKLKAAQDASDKNAITYLESIMPPDRKASQITPALGATWMDPDVFEDFVYHLLGGERPVKTGYRDIPKNELVAITRNEKKSSKASEYFIKIGDYAGRRMASAKAEYSTPDWGMAAMLKSALNNTDIKIYDTSRESKALNPEKTAAANDVKKRIRQEFQEWIFNDATRTEKVVAHYNERVNVYSGIKYDGAHITVPGAEPWVMERAQRKAAVWRILTSQEGVLLAHEVGTGKTLTMAAAAIEGRRTGLVKKAMYVAHNATVAQTVAEIARGFPGSRILAANDHNFSARQRRNFLAQAAVGDFDIVVLSQAQFELIASKQESRMKVLQAEIDELLEVAEAETNTKKAKQISKQIETIKAKIEKAQESIKGDRTTVFFEDIGIDMLLLDEAHAYKNLARASKHSSLSIPGSSRATDALIKIEAVRAANERGGRLVMATGTPIINSIGETHTWLKFLAPKTLQAMKMFGFDDFINALAEEVDSVERTPAGAPVRRKRFSKFINARDLRRIFGLVADVVRAADMVNAKGEKAINLPRYVDLDGNQADGPISVVVEATKAQRDAFAEVSRMYNEWAALPPRGRMESPHIPLVATTEGKLASVDARLFDPSLPADEGGKIAKCVENVLKVYKSTAKEKGAQAIFLDSGVPSGERFDLYADLTDRLVDAGIPKSEILSIYDVKRDDIGPTMRKVNAGQYRVVLGSTERLGTGINMQERLRAVHHLDSSYVASGLMQRDGRIMRSGNQYADGASIGGGVSVLYYITENSPDARMWTIVLRKVGIMNDVLYTADSEFGDSIEDVDPPSAVASFAEMTADAQGDPRMVRYIDLQAELAVLGNEGAYYQRQGVDRTYKLKKAERDAEESWAVAIKLASFKDIKKPEAGKWTLQGISHKLETRKELGEFVNANARKTASYYNTRSAILRNGTLAVKVELSSGEYPYTPFHNRGFTLKHAGEGAITITPDGGTPATFLIRSAKREEVDGETRTTIWMAEGPFLGSEAAEIKNGIGATGYKTLDDAIGGIIMEGIERLPKLQAQAEKAAKIAKAEVPEFKKLAEAPWPKLEEYKALQEENERLEDALGLKGKETQDITWAVNEADSAEELKDGDDPVEGEEESSGEVLGMPARSAAPSSGSKWYRADIEPLAVPAGVDPKTLSADAVMMSVPRSAVGNWRFGKTLRGLVGQMNPKNKTITMRYHGSPHEFAHEIGHHLDDQYRLVPQMKSTKTKAGGDHPWMKEFDKEILPMGDPFSPASADLTRRRQEGIARFVQLYMVAPGKATIEAPNFHKFFESKVPDTVLKDLREAGDKLRMIAGLDVVTRGGNQIEMEPSDIRKTSSMIAEAVGLSDGLKFPRYNIIGGFTTNWVDDLAGLEAAQKEAMLRLGIDEVLPSDDPTLLARTIKYHTQKINDIFQNGMIDAEGNRVTGPLSSILEPLDRTSMETLEKDLRDTMLLGISERQLEEAQRVMQDADNEAAILRMDGEDAAADAVIARAKERADSMTGISGGILPDGDIQAALDIIAVLKADPARHAALAKSLERMREVYDSVLEYGVEKGRFSRDQVDEIRNTHQQYIALQRMMDGDQGLSFLKSSGGLKNVGQPIKQYKGSTRKIKSPFIAMLEQINSTVFEADRNEVVTTMVDLLGGNEGRMYQKSADLSDLAVKVALDDTNKKNTIVIYRDGKQERWELDEVVYRALDIVGNPDMFDGLKAVRAIVTFTRQAITTFPAFAFFKNPIRDTVARVIHSRVGSKPWDLKLNPSKADRERFSRFGGSIMETDYLNDREMFLSAQRKLMEDAVTNKPKGWILAAPGRLWKAYVDLASRPEMSNRLAEESRAYKFAKSKGWSDYDAQLYASQQARDLQDFRRGGRWARRVNQFVMFFNASVQGLDRAYRGAKVDKKGYAFRILLYTVLAEIVVNQMASSQGQEAEEEYANLPAYQKDFFWNIRVGDAGYIRLPKPFELGLPASFVGRVMSGVRAQAQGNTREASRWFEGFMGSAVKALLVVDENTFMGGPFAPLYETMANFDFFRKKSIIPPYEESMILEDRKGTARGSYFGRMLQAASEAMGQGVDSRKIDHVVQQTFGGYGKVTTSLGKPDREVSPQDWLYMMTGLFTDKPAYGARDVQWVLKRASQIGTRKPLKDEVEAYFDAETKEEKEDAAKELLRRAAEIRNEMEDAAAGLPVREGVDAQRALFDLKPRDREDSTDD